MIEICVQAVGAEDCLSLKPASALKSETLRFAVQWLVTATVPTSDLTAELTLVDYVPAVHAAKLATMPDFVSGQYRLRHPPRRSSRGLGQTSPMTREVDG